ncbi:uncharacterized protein METZ01_LOCUS245200, partial [marine metagenome]
PWRWVVPAGLGGRGWPHRSAFQARPRFRDRRVGGDTTHRVHGRAGRRVFLRIGRQCRRLV